MKLYYSHTKPKKPLCAPQGGFVLWLATPAVYPFTGVIVKSGVWHSGPFLC